MSDMIMKDLISLLVVACMSVPAGAANIQGESGSLVYSEGLDGNFSSLVYKTKLGNILQVFDGGLSFNYDSRYEGSLSPDKAYSVVQFSESGTGSEISGAQSELEIIYLCAFVRMSDGCVVNVVSGAQCGGQWTGPRQWSSSMTYADHYLFKGAPTVDKVYKAYELGRKDSTQVTSPRILAYFLEGTTFDNLLACDPPRDVNKKMYSDLLALLQYDGDEENSEKLKLVLNSIGVRSPD